MGRSDLERERSDDEQRRGGCAPHMEGGDVAGDGGVGVGAAAPPPPGVQIPPSAPEVLGGATLPLAEPATRKRRVASDKQRACLARARAAKAAHRADRRACGDSASHAPTAAPPAEPPPGIVFHVF